MPSKPLRPCRYPGCSELVTKGYCENHSKEKHYDRFRGSSASRGYNSRWRAYRERYLAENPLCVECLKKNIVEPSTDVDHIVPVNGQSDPLFWNSKNHQALCHSCHSKKTARENGGFGNRTNG